MKLVFSDVALQNLEQIGGYIAQDSPAVAERMQVRLLEACRGLIGFPDLGRIGRRRGTRELTTVWPYVIVYRVRVDAISIERIIHGARRR